VADEQLIQVTFPFVKESIEVLQVRQLCHNINAFIESLHDVSPQTLDVSDVIDTELALQDRSAIPEQIKTPLKSPYVPKVPVRSEHNREKLVAEGAQSAQRVSNHVAELLKNQSGRTVLGEHPIRLATGDGTERPITIKLRAARASGELLLSASIKDREISLSHMTRKQLLS